MKKTVFLIGAIVWAVIAAAALIILIIGLSGGSLPGFMKGDSGVFIGRNTELVKEERFSLAGIDELNIRTYSHAIHIRLVGGDEMTVRQYDMDSDNLFATGTESGRLSVKVAQRTIVTMFGFSINPRLEIDLPQSYADVVVLETSSGSVKLSDIVQWGETSITSSSGTIRLDSGIICAALDVKSTSGSINLGEVKADSVTISSSSGTQRLENILSAGAVSLQSSSGSINCGSIIASECKVGASSGTIRLDDIEASGKITLESTSGSINTGSLRTENVSVKSNSGTLRLGDITAPGSVEIASTSGSQNVDVVSAGLFRISSNSGTLRYDGLSGAGSLQSSSGSITCGALDIRGDVSVTSSSGTQRLTLADNQSFEINISTSSGTIRAGDINLSYSDRNGKNAFGSVGGGTGGTLSVKSSSGSINID